MDRRLLTATLAIALLLAALTAVTAQGQDEEGGGEAEAEPDGLRHRRPAGHRQHEPADRRDGRRLRGLEPPVRDPDEQGGGRLLRDSRPRRVLGGLRGRADLDLQAAPEPEVVRRQAADVRGHRLDDQHLPRRGVAQPLGDHDEPDGERRRTRTTVVIKSKVPDPKLPIMDVYILPKHIWGEMSADERAKYDATDGVGSGPFVLEQFEKGQFARFRANPNYYERQAQGRQGRPAQVQQPRRDGRRAQDRRARRRRDPAAGRLRPAPEGRQHRHGRGLSGRHDRGRDQRRGRPQEAAPRAARPRGAQGDRARDRQGHPRRPRRGRPRHADRDPERLA